MSTEQPQRWVTHGGRVGHYLCTSPHRAANGHVLCREVVLWRPRLARDDEPTCKTCERRRKP